MDGAVATSIIMIVSDEIEKENYIPRDLRGVLLHLFVCLFVCLFSLG